MDVAPAPGTESIQGLYVHVPFCRHKCHYCDFYSFVDRDGRQGAYVDALERDVEASRPWLTNPLSTIFVGGGTPTLLPPAELARALAAIGSIPRDAGAEWTVESNPETVDEEKAGVMARAGVNRVSVGAQSFHEPSLLMLERHHDPASVGHAVRAIRAAGLQEINLDLIFGVPGSSLATWREDLARVIELGPSHVSCYALTYESGTPLDARLRQGRIVRMDEDLELEMLHVAIETLSAAGYEHYEISNWAGPGARCRHNELYWKMGSWWGMGPSATAQVGQSRWKIVPRLGDWLAGPPLGAVVDVERPGEDTWVGECFMMGLRLLDGVPEDRVVALLSLGREGDRRRRVLEAGVTRGWLEWRSGALRLTSRGLPLANELIAELLPSAERTTA